MTFILGLLLGGITILFIVQNMAPVSVSFFSWNMEGSLAIFLLLSVLMGMFITALFSIPDMFHLSGLRRSNKKLQAELDTQRQNLAVSEEKLKQAQTPVIIEDTNTEVR